MTPAQKVANQRVITAARWVERSAQYGMDGRRAHEELTEAKAALEVTR